MAEQEKIIFTGIWSLKQGWGSFLPLWLVDSCKSIMPHYNRNPGQAIDEAKSPTSLMVVAL